MKNIGLSREDFQLVVAIKESGSLTRAAERLHLSQSALSHHLRDLEDRIGQPLFERFPRKMMANALGEEFASLGKGIVLAFQDAERQILACACEPSKVIQLATECYTSYSWLPTLIQSLNKRKERTEMRIVLEATSRVRAALTDGDIDVAILNTPESSKHLELWPLFQDEVVLVVSSQHRFAKLRKITAAMVAEEPLLLHTAPDVRHPIMEDFLIPAGLQPKSVQHVSITEAIVEMVSAGLGIAPVTRWLIAPYVRTHDLTLLPLGSNGIHRTWHLAARRANPRQQEFARLAKALSFSIPQRYKR